MSVLRTDEILAEQGFESRVWLCNYDHETKSRNINVEADVLCDSCGGKMIPGVQVVIERIYRASEV